MEESLVVDVVVINKLLQVKKLSLILLFFVVAITNAQQDSTKVYKKKVLETTEVDFLSTYYSQDGNNASVTGGVGTEELTDLTGTIVVSIPLNADDVLTVDAGFSAYTSASSSNTNPFDLSNGNNSGNKIGSPWVASSGASGSDVWSNINIDYSHSSDDRNTIWNADASFANEYDYSSIGFGGGLTKLYNDKNTTLGLSANVYLDTWNPVYPIELRSYRDTNGNLNQGFFQGITIMDESGNTSTNWSPLNGFESTDNKSRNSYSVSFSFSQILSKNSQFSIFLDVVQQQGWLANPLQRVYFSDIDNYYVGNAASIPNYMSASNKDVFMLADDIERLPDSRLKLPFGFRFNYYLNEMFVIRTYYRYYFDDWGIKSNTFNIEVPIKISEKFTLYPSYRFYNQTAADYFAPFDSHLSTEDYYTSDYDLSKFNANQFGFGINYTDIFTKAHVWKFGLKSIDFQYNNYKRNTGLSANYFGIGFKFIKD